MSKVHFCVFKVKNVITNICIVMLLGIITAAAFLGGAKETSAAPQGVYYNGNTSSNKVALMINVYWGTEFLDDMLDVLEQKNAKATFFVGGTWAIDNADLLKTMLDEGHEIGNHGYKHKDQDKLSYDEAKKEISLTHNIVKDATTKEMTLFAPPSGAYNAQTVKVAEELGYKTIMWTRDTIDWRDHDANLIYSRALKGVKGGDLILMHPTQSTLDALGRIIDDIQNKGLELATVSETI